MVGERCIRGEVRAEALVDCIQAVSYTHLSEFTPEEISVIARIETVSTDISNSVRECEDCINVLKKEKNRHIDVKPSEMSDEDFMKLFK